MNVVHAPPTLSSNPMLVHPNETRICLFYSSIISFWPWIYGSSLVVVGPLFCGRLLAVSLRFRTWSSSSKNKRRLGLELLEAGKTFGDDTREVWPRPTAL